jgi:DNA-binding NarL/FixJ family response regulator
VPIEQTAASAASYVPVSRALPNRESQLPHALCVGRHRFLSDHLGAYFGRYGLTSTCVVGLAEAITAAEQRAPDVVICDYDLLATIPLDEWEQHETLSKLPVVAVSMTRRPDEMHPLDVNGIAGFLYLPSLRPESAQRILGAVAPATTVPALTWPSPNRPVSST